MPKELGGPAFPVDREFKGMTLRDYFAAHALGGMQARDTYDAGQQTPQQRAALAYLDADAMLAARDTPQKE